MRYDFDKRVDRGLESGSFSFKWQGYEGRFPGFEIDIPNAISMWVADMDFETLPQVKNAIIQRAGHGIYGYTEEANNDAFRDAAIGWFARRYGWSNCQRDWMLFCPGVVPALNTSVQAYTEVGDGVIIQPPVYYPFAAAIENNERVVKNNQLIEEHGRYRMDYDGLEKLAQDPKNKMAIFCSPHNPVGRVWTEEELDLAFRICAENDMVIVCDEIHADLIMPGHTFFTSGLLDEYYDRLVIAHAPSKTFNLAGLTSAFATIPNEKLRRAFAARAFANRLPGGNVFGPVAGAAAYTYGDEYVDELVSYIYGNVSFAKGWLAEYLPKAKMTALEGTYLVWIDFRDFGLDEEELYRLVLERANVVGDLGRWFGFGGEGFMRFNFATQRSVIEDFLVRLRTSFEDV